MTASRTLLLPIFALAGCVSVPCAAPGLQPAERRALRHSVWIGGPEVPASDSTAAALRGEPGAMHHIFARCAIGHRLDGEISETYTHDLWLTLFTVGDAAFARELAAEPVTTRRRLHDRLEWLFSHWHLSYPQTQTVLLTP